MGTRARACGQCALSRARRHALAARRHRSAGSDDRRACHPRPRAGGEGGDPRAQRHRRRADHRALHHRPLARCRREGDAAGARRAGRRRARLSRRGHALGRDPAAHDILAFGFDLAELGKVAAPLQPGEQDQARYRRCRRDREEPGPARRVHDVARTRRENGASEGGQRVQERKLRRGMERILAKGGEVGDENDRAYGARELLGGNGEGEQCHVSADQGLPGEGQDRDRLEDGANPEAWSQRNGSGDETARESTE